MLQGKDSRCWLPVGVLLLLPAGLGAQVRPPVVSVADYPPAYTGPGREPAADLALAEIRIGLFIPTEGARKQEGQSILRGAQHAIQEANARGGFQGKPFRLVVHSDAQPWGRATGDLVKMVYEEGVVAIVTSSDRGAAHLAEQVATKAQVPVLTFSSDPSLTQANIPWIYRFLADDSAQARTLVHYLFEQRERRSAFVLTVSSSGGATVGGAAATFKKLTLAFGATVFSLHVATSAEEDMQKALAVMNQVHPEAIVIWAAATESASLLHRLRQEKVTADLVVVPEGDPAILLENKEGLAEGVTLLLNSVPHADDVSQGPLPHCTAMADMASPTAYDAMRVLLAGIEKAGPNRARLRDALARTHLKGLTGDIAFDSLGNRLGALCLGIISSGRFRPIALPSGQAVP